MKNTLLAMGYTPVNNYYEKQVKEFTIVLVPISESVVIRRILLRTQIINIQKLSITDLQTDKIVDVLLATKMPQSGMAELKFGNFNPEIKLNFGKLKEE
jgi:hypothetical protein